MKNDPNGNEQAFCKLCHISLVPKRPHLSLIKILKNTKGMLELYNCLDPYLSQKLPFIFWCVGVLEEIMVGHFSRAFFGSPRHHWEFFHVPSGIFPNSWTGNPGRYHPPTIGVTQVLKWCWKSLKFKIQYLSKKTHPTQKSCECVGNSILSQLLFQSSNFSYII